ncbi:tetratricopeptide repeat protein [Pseudanabaena sp. FACHB-1998]|uniref:tetratricopeptide repeat protein n=1 Tax=Pseudanabaena sp. FACHB-1998 TaxID=2692858 RepID=UPI0016817798|nr:tetratricopeptide repeat protein [Pseudanabaena sp. FACHB-1998]MBD2178267.1 tetratricopeptide repeat protein [Pseudanabaena sp. FACHB-1998]
MSQPIEELLQDLKSEDEHIRDRATQNLWEMWFMQKGMQGLQVLRKSQTLADGGNFKQAELMLTQLIQDQPDFVEAWNRRAVLFYMQGNYKRSIKDCQKAIALNPYHFGAVHGLGLCYAAIGSYHEAIATFRIALEIQPFSLTNKKLILECTAML